MRDQAEASEQDEAVVELAIAQAREAATREILEVISQSRDDETPVFDLVLKHLAELCEAPIATLHLADRQRGEVNFAAHFGEELRYYKVGHSRFELDDHSILARCVSENRNFHIADLADTDLYREGDAIRVGTVDEEGIRTYLTVPLASQRQAIGCIGLYRRDVRPFSNDEIALIEAFAGKAVIAIENSQQFRELQTRLEHEEATRKILQVISQSRDDERPVFQAILDQAEKLCSSDGSGLFLLDDAGTHLSIVALGAGNDKATFPIGTEFDLKEPLGMCIATVENRIVHYEDLKETEPYKRGHEGRRKLVDVDGTQTTLNVPLLQDGKAFGSITLSRQEQKPYSSDEIALVETFASQAVIAIENVRQFREVQDRLAREAATNKILSVISQSRNDDLHVFESVVQQAVRIPVQ